MQSSAWLRVAPDATGVTRAVEVRGEVPQVLRVTDAPNSPGAALTIHLVGGGAGPLGGDRFGLRMVVEPGAHLRVRSTGATLALPGATGAPSLAVVDVSLGAEASLDWWPEPLIACAACDHTVATTVEAHETASWRWVDELVLGRGAERSGHLHLRQRISASGRVVWCQDLDVGPPPDRAGPTGTATVVVGVVARGSFADSGRDAAPQLTPHWRGAVMDLEGGGRHCSVLASTHSAARQGLAELGVA